MIAHHYLDIEGIAISGEAQGVTKRVLIGPDQAAPNFYLRHFTLEPQGHTPRHSHSWEHEIYITEGSGSDFLENEEVELQPGMAIFVPSKREHQIKAGMDGLKFLCIIPAIEEK